MVSTLLYSFLLVLICTGMAAGQEESEANSILLKLSRLFSTPFDASMIKELAMVVNFMEEAQDYLSDGSSNSSRALVQCLEDLQTLKNEQQEVKVIGNRTMSYSGLALAIDAAGKIPNGYLQGALSWRGNVEECKLINISMDHSSSMKYCSLSIALSEPDGNTVQLPIHEELCMPESCSSREVLQETFNLINKLETLTKIEIKLDASASQYFCFSMDSPPLTGDAYSMIQVCVIILLWAAISTIAEKLAPIISQYREQRRLKLLGIRADIQSDKEEEYNISEGTPLMPIPEKKSSRWGTFLYEVLTSFSLYKNIKTVLATHQPSAAITSLNGIRVISMFWVIFCHVILWMFMNGAVHNMNYFGVDVLPRFSSQVIINGFLSVDSFFFLSGALVSYLTMREMKRRDGRFPYLPYYLHRILRLTPTYMFVLFFYWFLTMYLAQGTPFYAAFLGPGSTNWNNCQSYWWTNLLYINNFYPPKFVDECMGWSWYLANDMQFFVISPLFIIPLFLWFPVGVVASGIAIVASFFVTGFISGHYNFTASQFFDTAWGIAVSPNAPDYSSQIYGKPYCRIGPYIIGLILGAVFYHRYKLFFSKLVNGLLYLLMWVVAFIIAMSVVYGLYGGFTDHLFTMPENISYNMLARTGWGVALALVVFACHHGYGGPINSFLSMPFWIPLSRLTFNAYLVHPIILTVVFGSQRSTIYYTDITIVPYIIGCVVLAYSAAALVSVFVEFPVANLEMACFKVLGVRLRESTRQPNVNGKEKSSSPALEKK